MEPNTNMKKFHIKLLHHLEEQNHKEVFLVKTFQKITNIKSYNWLIFIIVKNNEIINSFDLRNTLNPKVWDNYDNVNKASLKSEIRKNLISIAQEFLYFVEVDVIISDIVLMGSLVNYNWSEYSDFDLHIIADYNQYPKEQVQLYSELFDLKKTLFNLKHDIKIKGYDVELYLQDESDSAYSDGVYSLMFDEFVKKPSKTNFKINKELIKTKAEQWMKLIDECIEQSKTENTEESQKTLKKCYKKIKKYRQSGLEEGGEFSIGNLVFKYLRRNGYIGKLLEFRDQILDKNLSLQELNIFF